MTNWRRERSFDDPSQERSAMQLIRRFPETSALFRFKRMAHDDAWSFGILRAFSRDEARMSCDVLCDITS